MNNLQFTIYNSAFRPFGLIRRSTHFAKLGGKQKHHTFVSLWIFYRRPRLILSASFILK